MRIRVFLGALIVVAIGVWATRAYWASDSSDDGPPNVVVILIDTLRPDYLGAYGHEPETAPFVAKLAKKSTVFTRAFSTSSWTAPSTSSLFTAAYPTEHGVVMGFAAHRAQVEELESQGEASFPINRIPDDFTTLPEYFKAQGYTTFGMASNRNIGKEIGFTRGFDRFFEGYRMPVEVVLEELESWQEEIEASEPYFLYLHLNDVHMPYEIREPYWEDLDLHASGSRRRYLSEIGYVDAHLKKIYNRFKLDKNAVFVLVSDHGEEFRDHGDVDHSPQLYRELNRVLMLVHSRQPKVERQRLDVNVSLIDLFPTLIDLCGLPSLEDAQGTSLAPLLRDDSDAPALRDQLRERTIFAHRAHNHYPERQFWAATYQHWKLYEPWEKDPELYDHRVDFAEQDNVIDANGEMAETLAVRLAAFKAAVRDTSDSAIEVPLDKELLEELESLGYVE